MGRGDNRRTAKMRRRTGQRRKKEQSRKLQTTIAAKGTSAPPKPIKPTAPKSSKVTIKRSGQRRTAAATTS